MPIPTANLLLDVRLHQYLPHVVGCTNAAVHSVNTMWFWQFGGVREHRQKEWPGGKSTPEAKM